MQLKLTRQIWILTLLLAISMACSLTNGIGERFNQTRGTAQSVATKVQEGRHLLGTAQALATGVGESGLIETAQALATDFGESGLLETVQAFATKQGPKAIGTAQTFATEEGPRLIETIKAIATQEAPHIKETTQAIATKAAAAFGEAPADIPLVGGDKENFFGSKEMVSYMTPLPLEETSEFYKREMPAIGWIEMQEGWFESSTLVVLNYAKPDRIASVTLTTNPLGDKSVVVITIQPR